MQSRNDICVLHKNCLFTVLSKIKMSEHIKIPTVLDVFFPTEHSRNGISFDLFRFIFVRLISDNLHEIVKVTIFFFFFFLAFQIFIFVFQFLFFISLAFDIYKLLSVSVFSFNQFILLQEI